MAELRQILVERISRSGHLGAWLRARHHAEGVWVEPLVDRRLVQFAAAQPFGPCRRFACVESVALRYREWQARAKRDDAVRLPAAEDVFRRIVLERRNHWQFVEEADHGAVPEIETVTRLFGCAVARILISILGRTG